MCNKIGSHSDSRHKLGFLCFLSLREYYSELRGTDTSEIKIFISLVPGVGIEPTT